MTQVYDFISNNYELGDELFFLGFSRGAFTVRSAACLVSEIGILSAVNMGSFADMWKAYRARSSKSPFEESKWYRENSERLKIKTVPVKVVGVWDTVGALVRLNRFGFGQKHSANRSAGCATMAWCDSSASCWHSSQSEVCVS